MTQQSRASRTGSAIWLFSVLSLALSAAGCQPNAAAPSASADVANPTPTASTPAAPAQNDEPVATINGDDITMAQLQQPLIETYGLNVLLGLVELDLARQTAGQQNITVGPADIDQETTRTLVALRKASKQQSASTDPTAEEDTLTPTERDALLSQLLSSRKLSRGEFDIAMTTNAYLRKIVTPLVESKTTDAMVHDRFNALYGEKARIRFIRRPSVMAMSPIERELAEGRTFEDEVKRHLYDSPDGRPSAGEIAPFSRQDVNFPAEFKEVAFGLKPGQISNPLQLGDSCYIMQLIELIPPQHAKFEDYQDSVRQDLIEAEVQNAVVQYRYKLSDVMRTSLDVKEPTLKKQWDANIAKRNAQLRSAQELKDKMAREQQMATTQATITPATPPAPTDSIPGSAAPGSTAPGSAAPQATMPGATTSPAR